jgi:signal peptidase II
LTGARQMKSRLRTLIPDNSPLLKWSLFAVVLATGLTVDLITKHLADARLVFGESRDILPFLSLQLTHNDGVAFGMLGGSTGLIVVANVVALLVVLAYVLLEGGSLGNMIQRIVGDGHVTDFFRFPHWPNFNVADVLIDAGLAAVVIGMVVEVIKTWRAKKREAASSG